MSRNRHRKQFFVSDRLLGLGGRPWAIEPVTLGVGAKAKRTSGIGGDFNVSYSGHAGVQPKPNTVPRGKKALPPQQILAKLSIDADGMILVTKAAKQIDKSTKKGSARPYHLRSVVQVTNQRFEFAFLAPGTLEPGMNELAECLKFILWLAGNLLNRVELNS